MRRTLSLIALLLVVALTAAACSSSTADTTTTTATPTTMAPDTTTTTVEAEPTIADVVIASTEADPAEFTILLAAVLAADPSIVAALSDPMQQLTVFAPTDAAFGVALEALDMTADELLADTELLNAVLTYHVVAGVYDAAAVIGAAPIEALATLNADATLNVQVIGGNVVVNDGTEPLGGSTVIQPDVMASNGVIHVVDTVLIPGA
jgi:uncharacterized surface protein with fasciclin (FAS1) repeats